MEYFAKSKPRETIAVHTGELLKRFHVLKSSYGSRSLEMSDRDWQLLEWAVLYHDIGKYNPVFQQKLRKVLGESPIELSVSYDLQHNFLSVLAVPKKALKLDKVERSLLFQAIGFHHERERLDSKEQLCLMYDTYFSALKEIILTEIGVEIAASSSPSSLGALEHSKRYTEIENGEDFYRYVRIKGLLHRLDHAASAHVPIAVAIDSNPGKRTEQFIQRSFPNTGLNPLQQFAKSNRPNHVIAVAQTGMGKTEAGLLWIGEDKAFFTLPLRVSLNSMYKRLIQRDGLNLNDSGTSIHEFLPEDEAVEDFAGEQAVGLLHSTSLDYLEQMLGEEESRGKNVRINTSPQKDEERLTLIHSATKEYANPLIICTVDQILKFPLYYLGFEKEYATMAYSKVVIDELQAYSPEIAAIIIRALVMIDRIGSSFMIMTATLPKLYKEALEQELLRGQKEPKHQLAMSPKPFINDTNLRHHIEIHKESILSSLAMNHILQDAETKSVLVICNTVNRAKEVFKALRKAKRANKQNMRIMLLHSRFVRGHRAKLEQRLLEFEQSKQPGIWVTTQLVEASLDIDFDRLYTEMSVLDSQFQRYGRCNRRGSKEVSEANIHIFSGDVSGIDSVYNETLYQNSLSLLMYHTGTVLKESVKQQMIEELYDRQNLQGSDFLTQFDKALEEIRNFSPYDINKAEAQKIFREIHEIQAIPQIFLKSKVIEDALNTVNRSGATWAEKKKARKVVEQYTVGVNKFSAGKMAYPLPEFPDLYIINAPYSSKTGLDANSAYSSIFM